MIIVTPMYAYPLALMLIGLSIGVAKGRQKLVAGLGDADNIKMKRRIHVQANLVEYTAIFIILLGFSEHNGLLHLAIHLFGLVFLGGSIMHAYSLVKAEQYNGNKLVANPVWRILGMICTFSDIGLLALVILVQGVV